MDVRRAIAALLLLGLLVSCSDDEPSSDPPEPTGSATVTDRVPPSPSGDSRDPTKAGAEAFVELWVDSFNYAMQTGDTATFRPLSSNECTSCQAVIKKIEQIYGPGGHVESDGWLIEKFSGTSLAGNSKASVTAVIALSPQLIHRAGQEKPDKRSGGEGTATFSLTRINSAWRVNKILQAPA